MTVGWKMAVGTVALAATPKISGSDRSDRMAGPVAAGGTVGVAGLALAGGIGVAAGAGPAVPLVGAAVIA